jgi:hypothetical protein
LAGVAPGFRSTRAGASALNSGLDQQERRSVHRRTPGRSARLRGTACRSGSRSCPDVRLGPACRGRASARPASTSMPASLRGLPFHQEYYRVNGDLDGKVSCLKWTLWGSRSRPSPLPATIEDPAQGMIVSRAVPGHRQRRRDRTAVERRKYLRRRRPARPLESRPVVERAGQVPHALHANGRCHAAEEHDH